MPMDFEPLLETSRELQRATDLRGLLEAVRSGVMKATRYRTTWLAAYEDLPEGELVRILSVEGPGAQAVWAHAPRFPSAGDGMLAEIKAGRRPVVVEDARTDPRTNKDIVERVQNRTIINVPLLLGNHVVGALGVGTYGDEGCLPPMPEELERLTVMALLVAPAFDRVRLHEQARAAEVEREELRRRLQRMERIETLALLSGGVAHDFNNLLTVILNALHFVGEEPLSEQARQDVKDATEAADRAREVTQQLLAMGRRQALRVGPVDWALRVRELTRLLRRVIPETVELVVDAEEDLPRVLADGSQLDQVVMNLALNARDAMPQGGTLRFVLSRAALDLQAALPLKVRAGPAVRLQVIDSGTGMSPEVVEHVFEPFFTTKAPGSGTGLGLATSQGIVHQHGGTIECLSLPGKGTTFSVTLPVATEDLVQAAPPQRTAPGGHERILAAEDDASIRELLVRILEDAGYRVTVVPDGEAAVEAARLESFDLILLDAVMPRLTGREAFERIRELRPHAGWLFMSGYTADALPPDFLARHGVELLEKPWRPAQLLDAVRRGLQRAAATRA